MSLIGKALARSPLRNSAPVPMDTGGLYHLPGLAMGGNADETLMRAYASQGTVYANVSLLARATAGPVWKLFRKAPQDGRRRYTTSDQGSDQRVEVVNHQALEVLNNPASVITGGKETTFWTRFSLFEISQIWMECTGKSTWVVEYDPRANFPVGLWPVRPDRMTPIPDRDKYLAGWVYTAPDGREHIPLGVDEVIYNRYPDPLDTFGGVGPIGSVLVDVDAARYAAEWNRNFFLNSAEPGGVLQADHALEDDEYNALVNRWREAHKGVSRSHRIALLESGVTWVQTHNSMKDMDFGGLRLSSRDIIREALAMHKVMTGVTDDVNRANAQTGEEVFASWQISPRLDRWRDVFNSQYLPLFGSTGNGVEFDYVYPMPQNREQDNAELTAKSTAALALIQAGYDPHAVLEVVGLPDMGVAETATQTPALPPGWVPGAPAAAPGNPGAGEEAAESAGGGDMANRLRKMLSNGHMTVGV